MDGLGRRQSGAREDFILQIGVQAMHAVQDDQARLSRGDLV
jgi:hypothetical protein